MLTIKKRNFKIRNNLTIKKELKKNNGKLNIVLKKKTYKSMYLAIENTWASKSIVTKNSVDYLCTESRSIFHFHVGGPLDPKVSEVIDELVFYEEIVTESSSSILKTSKLIKHIIADREVYTSQDVGRYVFGFETKQKKKKFINFFISTYNGLVFGWTFTLNFVNMNFKVYIDRKEQLLTFFVGNSHGNVLAYSGNSVFITLNKKKKNIKINIL